MDVEDLALARRARFDEARHRRRPKPSFSIAMKKPASACSTDVLTSRRLCCSSFAGYFDDASERTEASQTNGDSSPGSEPSVANIVALLAAMDLDELAIAQRAHFAEARARRRLKPSLSMATKKPALACSADVLTPKSLRCGTFAGFVDDDIGSSGASQSSGDSSLGSKPIVADVAALLWNGQLKAKAGDVSPESHVCAFELDDATSLAEAAYSGDGSDQRWLAETEGEE